MTNLPKPPKSTEPTSTEPQIAQISQTTCWYQPPTDQRVLSDVGGDQ